MKAIFREPLLHFAVAGALIFIVYGFMAEDGIRDANAIHITRADIQRLASGYTRTWQRPPTESELMDMVREHVREEVFYREAMALGLDRDDTVIRRRLRQKMEFLSADMLEQKEASDAELAQYLRDHQERYRQNTVYSFRQIYFSSQQRGEGLEKTVADLLAALNQSGNTVDPEQLGDNTLLPLDVRDEDTQAIAAQFGDGFVKSLEALPAHAVDASMWFGPIESSYGIHLVRIEKCVAGTVPALDDVRAAVKTDWYNEQLRLANEKHFQQLLARYPVSIEGMQADVLQKSGAL